MLQNAHLLAKIGADTAENEQHIAEILPIGRCVADRRTEALAPRRGERGAGKRPHPRCPPGQSAERAAKKQVAIPRCPSVHCQMFSRRATRSKFQAGVLNYCFPSTSRYSCTSINIFSFLDSPAWLCAQMKAAQSMSAKLAADLQSPGFEFGTDTCIAKFGKIGSGHHSQLLCSPRSNQLILREGARGRSNMN